jgi:hypothetical protein
MLEEKNDNLQMQTELHKSIHQNQLQQWSNTETEAAEEKYRKPNCIEAREN